MGKARNCKLKVKCPQGQDADYTEDMVKQLILAGMYDDEIKKVISIFDLDTKSLNKTITMIEIEEKALRSMSGLTMALPDVAGVASHKNLPSSVNWQEKAKCVGCQIAFIKQRVKKVPGKGEIVTTDKFCKQ